MKWMMRSTRAKPTDPCLAPAIGALAGTGILKPLAIAEGFPENCGQGVQGKSKNAAIANETSATMPGADAAAVGDGPVADARPDQIRLSVMVSTPRIACASNHNCGIVRAILLLPPPIGRTIFHIPDGQRQPCPSPT